MKKLFVIAALACLAFVGGCDPSGPVQASTSTQNAKAVEDNQQRLQTAQPAPRLDVSLERQNLVERLKRLNKQNMSGYIYLLNKGGSVVAFYPVRGKATSLNAYLMAGEALQEDSKCRHFGDYTCPGQAVEQPDYDGAYGKNAEGIFFFTADTNAYVEWSGDYLFSDQPLKLSQQPLMVRSVND